MINSNLLGRLVSGVLLIFIAGSGMGCEILGNNDTDDTVLEAQRRIWSDLSNGTYSYTLQRGCFCIHSGIFEVFVEDYEVVDVIPAWDSDPGISTEDFHIFPTIEDLFEMLKNAYDTGADSIEVEYSASGYPESIDIDYVEKYVDDEMSIRVSEVVLPESKQE